LQLSVAWETLDELQSLLMPETGQRKGGGWRWATNAKKKKEWY
jgi:hypothetical protein